MASIAQISDKVAEAAEHGTPVVALESTIISHGMPYPQNVETAILVENSLREHGVEPATVAVLQGKLKVGLTEAEIDQLGRTGQAARKCSRRDLASALALGQTGATTVSGTMIGAHAAGIGVFVTGGIGGVHRGFEETMDVSADITELGRTPVGVVCAGAKSILDIPRTLEALETSGVCVGSLAAEEFPAFFSPRSGIAAPHVFASEAEVAATLDAAEQLGLDSGTVVAVPNPEPAEGEAIEEAVQQALREAEAAKVGGRDVTPFLLKRVNELTEGASLRSNIALVLSNARAGAAIAAELQRLRNLRGIPSARVPGLAAPRVAVIPSQTSGQSTRQFSSLATGANRAAGALAAGCREPRPAFRRGILGIRRVSSSAPRLAVESNPQEAAAAAAQELVGELLLVPGTVSWLEGAPAAAVDRPFHRRKPRIVVVGGSAVDVTARPGGRAEDGGTGDEIAPGVFRGTSNPGVVRNTFGGVGRNMAEAAARLGADVVLVTALGSDGPGKALVDHCAGVGVKVSKGSLRKGARTPQYVALTDSNGEMVTAVADMQASDELPPAAINDDPGALSAIQAAEVMLVDGNVPEETLAAALQAAAATSKDRK